MFEEIRRIAELDWNPREVLRVTLNECKGHRYVHLRVWYRESVASPALKPGRQGLAVPLKLLLQFYEAVGKAVEAVSPVGYEDEKG